LIFSFSKLKFVLTFFILIFLKQLTTTARKITKFTLIALIWLCGLGARAQSTTAHHFVESEISSSDHSARD
jgi:hypothetical protein